MVLADSTFGCEPERADSNSVNHPLVCRNWITKLLFEESIWTIYGKPALVNQMTMKIIVGLVTNVRVRIPLPRQKWL